ELRVPLEALRVLRGIAPAIVCVGPHASTTPRATLRKLDVSAVVLGECEEVLVELADTPPDGWGELSSVAVASPDGGSMARGGPRAVDLAHLPPLRWSA